MAVTFRSAGSLTTGAATATSLAIPMPAGFVAGDVLVASVTADGGTGVVFTPPSGWTLMQSTVQTTNARLTTYWRLATGGETATQTWTFDVAVMASGSIIAYSGAHPFLPMAWSNTNNASAVTALTPIGIQSTYTGIAVQVFSTRNTTGVVTSTPAGGNTERVDTSTTASTYIGLVVQDSVKTLPVGGTTVTASTASAAVTYIEQSFFISDARPEFNVLGIDEMSGGSTASSVTSTAPVAAFSTNYPNELILVIVNIGKSVQTVTSVTGGSLTWELVGRANTLNGSSEVWRSVARSTLSRQSITVNFSGTVTGVNTLVMGIRGADTTGTNGNTGIGAIVTGTSTTAAPSVVLNTTKSNAWVWGSFNDPDGNRSTTAGSGQTIVRSFGDGTNAITGWTQQANALTPNPGTAVTVNATAPTTDSCNIIAFEIIPLRKPRQGFTAGGGFGIA